MSESAETFVKKYRVFRRILAGSLTDQEVELFELQLGGEGGHSVREFINDLVKRQAVAQLTGLIAVKDQRRVGHLAIQADIAIEHFRNLLTLHDRWTELVHLCGGRSAVFAAITKHRRAIRAA